MSNDQKSAIFISDEYREIQRKLHQDPNYGRASLEYAPTVAQVMNERGYTEVLDYGAGKGRLGPAVAEYTNHDITVIHYEPAVPQWSARPAPCKFVACIDVLEHIEPDLLPNVLDDLQRVVLEFGLFTVATGPARKILSDGRNAHLIQKPAAWWLPQFMERFELFAFNRTPNGFLVAVESKRG
jgi:hypothetical protein